MSVDKIGVEIECGSKLTFDDDVDGWETKEDCSLERTRTMPDYYEMIEYASEPMGLLEIETKLKNLYEKTALQRNSTCGMHVHVSVKGKKAEERVMTGKFAMAFQDALEKDETAAGKLARWNNDFCLPYKSLQCAEEESECCDNRYRMVNFCAMGDHGTIEFRAWKTPNKVEEALEIVRFVHKFVDEYLKPKQMKLIEQEKLVEVTA